MEEGQFLIGTDLEHLGPGDRPRGRGLGLGRFGRQLGEELHPGDPDRAGESLLVQDPAAELVGDLHRRTEQPPGAPDIEERLVERDRLDERRERPEDLHHPTADLAVVGVIAGQEHGVGAQPLGPRPGHGRVDAVRTGLVRRGRHHPAGTAAAHHHRLAPQLRSAQQLDRHEEGVHVDVEDAGLVVWRPAHGSPLTAGRRR